jgi:hypothetical protein
MTNFIRLSSRLINKLHIVEIIHNPSKYSIHLSKFKLDGFMLVSSGKIETNHFLIEICEKDNKKDYDTISELFKEIK